MIDNTFNEFALNELSFTMVFEYVIGIKILLNVRVRRNVTHDNLFKQVKRIVYNIKLLKS